MINFDENEGRIEKIYIFPFIVFVSGIVGDHFKVISKVFKTMKCLRNSMKKIEILTKSSIFDHFEKKQ